jgi:hypothetical protein
MKKLVLAGLAAALVLAGAPAAHAHPGYHYLGGCGMVAVNDTTPAGILSGGINTWGAVLIASAVATEADGVTPAPSATITVDCSVHVNGASGPFGRLADGVGAAAGAGGPFILDAAPDAVIEVCERVTVAGEAHSRCTRGSVVETPVPDPPLEVDRLVAVVDAALCSILRMLAPGLPGIADIAPDGDLSVLGLTVYDCRPFNTGGGQVGTVRVLYDLP